MNEITKGNWKVSPACSGVVVSDGKPGENDTRGSIKYYGGALIAESCSDADAAIIAAAPKMLEALKEILPFAAEFINDNHPAMQRAKVAIKKATVTL